MAFCKRARMGAVRSCVAARVEGAALEPRVLFARPCVGLRLSPDTSPVPPGVVAVQTPAPVTGPAALSPLSAVPLLHSYPSGAASIYLDFVGAPAQKWG